MGLFSPLMMRAKVNNTTGPTTESPNSIQKQSAIAAQPTLIMDQNKWLSLLETKIENLQEQLAKKEDIIEELHSGLTSNLQNINKLEEKQNLCLQNSRHDEFTLWNKEDNTLNSNENNNNTDTTTNNNTNSTTIAELTQQLEDKTIEASSLQVQLETQQIMTKDLHERIEMTAQGKTELASQLELLENKSRDQQVQLDALQSLNETNTSLLKELGLNGNGNNNDNHSKKNSPTSSPTPFYGQNNNTSANNNNNKWEIYGKLQRLMEENNKLSIQLGNMADEKQKAERRVVDAETENRQLMLQIAQLGQQLSEKEQELADIKQNRYDAGRSWNETGREEMTDMNASINSNSNSNNNSNSNSNDNNNSSSVLSDIQQVLDIFGDDSDDDNEEEDNNNDADEDKSSATNSKNDTKLLKCSLQVCLSQIQQLQRDRESFLQKTAQQSVALADSRAQVDTLRGKVEHYESVLDSVLEQHKTTGKTTAAGEMIVEDRRDPVSPTSIYDSSIQSSFDSPTISYDNGITNFNSNSNMATNNSSGDNSEHSDNSDGDTVAVPPTNNRPLRKLMLPSFLANRNHRTDNI